eukprot:scaffold10284_cov118-Isochrysis_galbana.AAC.1
MYKAAGESRVNAARLALEDSRIRMFCRILRRTLPSCAGSFGPCALRCAGSCTLGCVCVECGV